MDMISCNGCLALVEKDLACRVGAMGNSRDNMHSKCASRRTHVEIRIFLRTTRSADDMSGYPILPPPRLTEY